MKAVALLAMLGACDHVSRSDYFPGWQISLRFTPPTKGNTARSGHLLARGPGNVIVLEYVTMESIGPDGQISDTIRVELADPPRPGVMERPRAYNQHCPGIWMCRDETLLRGRVTVKAVDARSVVADLDLEFPSVHLRRMEAFGSATPHERDIEPP